MEPEVLAPEVVAHYLAIAASVLTMLVMVSGAVRVVRATGNKISTWAADRWSVIGRVFAAVAVLFVLAAILSLTATNAGLGARINALENELRFRTADFGPTEVMRFGRVHQAPRGGVVTASIIATGGTLRRGICGWVAADMASLASQKDGEDIDEDIGPNALKVGGDAAHYTGETNVPYGMIFMPVRSGEFWVVRQCAGAPENTKVQTLFHPLSVARGTP